MNSSAAHSRSSKTRTVASPSPRTARVRPARTALVNLAFAGAAVLCVLASKPGHASEGIVGNAAAGASSLRVQPNGGEGIRVPAEAFAVASADLDGLRRQAALVSSPTEERLGPTGAQAGRASVDDALSTIVEPVTIAVLGFTAAALLAFRRRKNESASTEAISE